MTLLSIEGLMGVVREIAPPILYGIQTPYEDSMLDSVDPALEKSNADGAERLAVRLRNEIGIYSRCGPMWAEWNGFLKDGRSVWLQSSDRELIIHIYPTEDSIPLNIHARWDRINHVIDTYEEQDPRQQQPAVSYESRQPENSIPQTLTPWHVSRDFAAVLGQIEQAIEQPIWPSLG